MYRSISTVNADKAQRLYSANGQDIVWAVLASGIDGEHPHFRKHKNLDLPPPLAHKDFTGAEVESPLRDDYGIGTRIAGIIAGEMTSEDGQVIAQLHRYQENGDKVEEDVPVPSIAGMAPQCKLLSMKILDDKGHGATSSAIAALAAIQEMNVFGRRILVHGVLISTGNTYDPERFACGLSPICVEVERLIRSGVTVVVASGNSGYAVSQTRFTGVVSTGLEASISDPGNAELAITVGSTHRELPRLYGVSYFSGKGPTVDGRLKPDLVAPGEKIASCSVKGEKEAEGKPVGHYVEDSGTSMAAAHVAGVIAGFLSVRREYIGRPEMVKQVFLNSATDLRRSPSYQGKGLIDALKALQYDDSSTQQFDVAPTPSDIAPIRAVATVSSASLADHKSPLRLMCSYAREDEALWSELKGHLASLKRQGLIEIWYDRSILPGDEWKTEIANSLEQSAIILLLISSYFLDSDYCYDIEMKRAVERHNAGQAAVIPVIARASDWAGTPFAKIQALPQDGKPATRWEDQHEAWENVVQGIRKVVDKLNNKSPQT